MAHFDIQKVDDVQPQRAGEVCYDEYRDLVYLRIGVNGFWLHPDDARRIAEELGRALEGRQS